MTCSRRYDPAMLRWQTPQGSRSKYQHIYEDFIQGLLTGKLSPGERLPTEETWAKEYGYGRPAVLQAKGKLKHDGLIVTRQPSRGTSVVVDAIEIVQKKQARTAGPPNHRPEVVSEFEKPFGTYLMEEPVKALLYPGPEYRLRWPTAAEIAAGTFHRHELVIDAIAPDGTVQSYGIFHNTFKIQWDPPEENA